MESFLISNSPDSVLRVVVQKKRDDSRNTGSGKITWPWFQQLDGYFSDKAEMTFPEKVASIGGKAFIPNFIGASRCSSLLFLIANGVQNCPVREKRRGGNDEFDDSV